MRINKTDLYQAVARLNRQAGFINDPVYNTIGSYQLSCAYGGYALHKVVNEGGGITDVLNTGHIKGKDLYEQIGALSIGIQIGLDMAAAAIKKVTR